jgi:hypothetical protein
MKEARAPISRAAFAIKNRKFLLLRKPLFDPKVTDILPSAVR